jgi:hypothetical protein
VFVARGLPVGSTTTAVSVSVVVSSPVDGVLLRLRS